jgi:hypothetical protein
MTDVSASANESHGHGDVVAISVPRANSEFSVLESMFPRTAEGVYIWPVLRSADGSDNAENARLIEAQRTVVAVWKRRIKAHQRRLRFRKFIFDLLAAYLEVRLFLLRSGNLPSAVAFYFFGNKRDHG